MKKILIAAIILSSSLVYAQRPAPIIPIPAPWSISENSTIGQIRISTTVFCEGIHGTAYSFGFPVNVKKTDVKITDGTASLYADNPAGYVLNNGGKETHNHTVQVVGLIVNCDIYGADLGIDVIVSYEK